MTVTTVKHVCYQFTLQSFNFAAISGTVVRSSAAQTGTQDKQANRSTSEADRLITEGVAALERNDSAAAEKLFKQALSLSPKNAAAHTYLGVLADRAGNLTEAQRHFEAAAAIEPSSPSARNNLGAVLLKRGFTKQAAAQFEASLKVNRNQPSALINLAQIRFASGYTRRSGEARKLFEQAYALAPDAEIARGLVVVALRLSDKTAAAKYFREYSAGTQVAATVASRSELGAALLEAGMLKEAEIELSAALKLAPMDQDVVLRLARVYVACKGSARSRTHT